MVQTLVRVALNAQNALILPTPATIVHTQALAVFRIVFGGFHLLTFVEEALSRGSLSVSTWASLSISNHRERR